MKRIPTSLAIPAAMAMLFAAHDVLAQSDAGALLNEQQKQKQAVPDRLPQEQGSVRPALKAAGGVKVSLRAVHFTGAVELASEAELQAEVADAVGHDVGFDAMQQLAERVTALLHRKGYFLARAYLPQQDVTSGTLEIALLHGRLDGKEGKGSPYTIVPDTGQPPRIAMERLDAIAAGHLSPGAAVSDNTLERTVLLVNDLPGVSTQARLEAGAEPDSTRVVMDVREGPLLSGGVQLDNLGNSNTGATQLSVSGSLNDPLRIGDQLGAGETHSQGMNFSHLAYSLPLGSDGLRLAGSWAYMHYRIVDGTGEAAGLSGHSDYGTLGLSYPFIRSREANLYGNLTWDTKRLVDNATAGQLDDKRINEGTAGISGDFLDRVGGGAYTAWSLSWTEGNLDLGSDAANATADAAGYQTQGSFNKFNYGINRLQKLPANFSVSASLTGQGANKNLDSAEKFILGGPYGVRAYPVGEGLGDDGWMVNLELRYDLPQTEAGQWQFVTFYDNGHVTQHKDGDNIPVPTATGDNSYSLSGWGLGVNFNSGRFNLRASWAQKIGDNPGRSKAGLDVDGHDDRSRFWLTASIAL